jgi:hypothetical protein
MNKFEQLILLHVVTISWLLLIAWIIQGSFSEWTFRARQKASWALLPGRLGNKEVWIKQQRLIAYISYHWRFWWSFTRPPFIGSWLNDEEDERF